MGRGNLGGGVAGRLGAGVLFPFLEPPKLALNGQGSLLCLRGCEVNVNLLLLFCLLGVACFPLLIWAGGLVGGWGCLGVELAHLGG